MSSKSKKVTAAAPHFMETMKVVKGRRVTAYSRSFKLVSVNGRQWMRKVNGDSQVKIPASVQVKTTSRPAVGQLAKRAASKLFSIYCHHTNKKGDCVASIVIREITKCVPNEKQKVYKYSAGRKVIKEEERGPFGQEYVNVLHTQKPQSLRKDRGSKNSKGRSKKTSLKKNSKN